MSLTEYLTTDVASGKLVRNRQPSITNTPYRVAIVGEAPGRDEEIRGEPFVGMSGRFLSALLSKAAIVREACFIGNVCQQRPPNNDINMFSWNGNEIQSGLRELKEDLDVFNPNICVLLGKTALFAAKRTEKIGDWRGSLFVADVDGPFLGRKCITSYHPAACLRQYEWTQLLVFDLKKARREAESPQLVVPFRDLQVDLSLNQILDHLDRIKHHKPKISVDIEGGIDSMSCLSIAESAEKSFIVPFAKLDGSNYYENLDDEVKVWRALSSVLSDPAIPKVLQNSLYDRFILQYSYNTVVSGTTDDTMLKHWELYCELEKALGFQASIYTNEPYYKSDRKSDVRDVFWRYCCRDSAVTFEINEKLDRLLDAGQKEHYQFNVGLLNPILYMELRGIRYNSQLAKQRLCEVNHAIYELQAKLDAIAGVGLSTTESRDELTKKVRLAMCYKKSPTTPRKPFTEDYDLAMRILVGEGPLTPANIGFLNIACGYSMNIKSGNFKKFLYDTLKLPKQFHKDTGAVSTDYECLLKLKKKSPHEAVDLALQIGALRTRAQMLEIGADKDQRVRCGYNVVGSETGRLTCYTSPTGSGYNLQTIPSEDPLKASGHPLRSGMRDLFQADEGHYVFQCDLSGADGWTVAAHLAALGDRTMLDDYLAGIKPAKVLCYLLRHGANSLRGKQRDEVLEATKEVRKEDWDYFACKIGQHGSCYLMGPLKLANQIFVQSEGQVNLSTNEARALQELFFVRYRVRLWHDWMSRQLARTPELQCSGGRRRRFFGRAKEILGEALADEPQYNTTRATNLAVWRLWTDPENRMDMHILPTGSSSGTIPVLQYMWHERLPLRIEPLHQVHDALVGQFRIEDTAWALGRIKSYFTNEIVIAGQSITIPFEGAYGESWGNLTKGTFS